MNTDDMKFSQLVGILKAKEMESGGEQEKRVNGSFSPLIRRKIRFKYCMIH